MGRKSAKLNFASLLGPPPTVDGRNIDWLQIERAYGHALPPPARSQIVDVTNNLLEFSAFALSARPVAEAVERLRALGVLHVIC